MGCGTLRASKIKKPALCLSLLGILAMHRPIAEGATILTEPQQPGAITQILADPERDGIAIRDRAFVSRAVGFDLQFSLNPVAGSAVGPMAAHSVGSGAAYPAVLDVPATRLTSDRDASAPVNVPPDLLPSGNVLWFPFERRWLSPQSTSLNEVSPPARTTPPLVPSKQPMLNSSPIPLLPAAESALALGVGVCVLALVKRGRQAFR